jgi:hypothetical protein
VSAITSATSRRAPIRSAVSVEDEAVTDAIAAAGRWATGRVFCLVVRADVFFVRLVAPLGLDCSCCTCGWGAGGGGTYTGGWIAGDCVRGADGVGDGGGGGGGGAGG